MKALIRIVSICAVSCIGIIEVTLGQGATLMGTVTDVDDGQPLPGANVVVLHEASSAMIGGAAADPDGRYVISSLPEGTYILRATYTGYLEWSKIVSLSEGDERTEDIGMSAGIELGVVTVVGNKVAKKEDFPMPVETIQPIEFVEDVTTSTVNVLRKKTGVDQQCTGVDRCETVLRGFNNAFSGAVHALTDYRQSAVPSLAVNIFSIMPGISSDIDRVEVVRGPASALYGPGVDAGVVQFLTKNPIDHPGTTIAISGGQQSFFGFEGRTAHRLSDHVGLKITGGYGQADDWELDPNTSDSLWINLDGEARNPEFRKYNANGMLSLDLAGGAGGRLTASGGVAGMQAAVLSGIGTVQADHFRYWYSQLTYQKRGATSGLFATAYLNKNNAGDSYVYGAFPVVDKSALYVAQVQADKTFGSATAIVGVDFQFTRPDTEGKINGRNEQNDNTDEYGVYGQVEYAFTPRLAVTGAARLDYDSVIEKSRFSPRAGIVFKPMSGHAFRASYNKAFSSPGTNSSFLDIVAGRVPDTEILVRGRGSAAGFNWRRNDGYTALGAPTNLVSSSLLPSSLGADRPQGVFLEEFWGLLHFGLAQIPADQLAAQLEGALGLPSGSISPQTVAFLVDQLGPENTTVAGFVPGLLSIVNLETGQVDKLPEDLTNVAPLSQTITQTGELGYSGFFGFGGGGETGLYVAIDGYVANKKDFVGPLLLETPFVVTPTLATRLESSLAVGIGDNATLMGALAQLEAALGLPPGSIPPDAIANQIVTLADGLGAFPSAVGIVQPAENNPGYDASTGEVTPGMTPELMLAYRNFGEIDYWGFDAAFELTASRRLSFFGNVSVVSDDFFDNEELDESGTSLSLALNAPTLKWRIGGRYSAPQGPHVSLAGRYTKGFPIASGPYVGDLESYFLLDLGFGYDMGRFASGLRLDVGIQNLLDNEHREFVGAPQLGRMGIVKATYTMPH
jgi:iron complex outermembrane receptor protein